MCRERRPSKDTLRRRIQVVDPEDLRIRNVGGRRFVAGNNGDACAAVLRISPRRRACAGAEWRSREESALRCHVRAVFLGVVIVMWRPVSFEKRRHR